MASKDTTPDQILPKGLQKDPADSSQGFSGHAIATGLSGRYALALFDLAKSQNKLETVRLDLDKLSAMMGESSDFRAFILSPLLSRITQKNTVAALAKNSGLSDLVAQFLGVLAQNRRLPLLAALLRDMTRLFEHHNGVVRAEVTSAVALTKAQLTDIETLLKASHGGNIALEAQVEPDLLGGLIVKIGSRMIDNSVKTKLDNLKVAMKGVQ